MKILLGLSGGVDSAYAALSLIREGHEVEGAVLRMHRYTETEAAEKVARALSIPFHIIDAEERFAQAVGDNFTNEYALGRTPNPCVICNAEVKLRLLFDFALDFGFDAIATGHYARIEKIDTEDGVRYAVAQPYDADKDQTYMLYRVPQDILSRLVLPLSKEKKKHIKEEAEALMLVPREKKESQEICFIPDGDYASFIEAKRGKFPEGDFIDGFGNTLGRHKGIVHYTVGQRKGLGISLGERAFVTDIDAVKNTVTLSFDAPTAKGVTLTDMAFSGMKAPESDCVRELSVKVRYRAKPILCTACFSSSGVAELEFSAPCSFVALGQSAVLYDGDTVMAGGVIDRIER